MLVKKISATQNFLPKSNLQEAAKNFTVARAQRISEAGRECFFGYYDNRAMDTLGRRCLCHRVDFQDRLGGPNDAAEIGWYEDHDSTGRWNFHSLGTTRAWNFQQGAMLQWAGPEDRWLLWNDAVPGEAAFSVQYDVATGQMRHLPRPIANVSRDGRSALSINFERMFDYRPGYGYANRRDPFFDVLAPEDDGVFWMDLATGEHRLVLSLKQVGDLMLGAGGVAGHKVLINHITFNPSASQFIAIARCFQSPAERQILSCGILANADGSAAMVLLPFGILSHYWWLSDREMLFWCDGPSGPTLYRLDVPSGVRHAVNPTLFPEDIHMTASPCGEWMLYDGYPDAEHQCPLALYHLNSGKNFPLTKLASKKPALIDLRCDLHPRWNPNGRGFTFESTHEGFRGLYHMETESLFNKMASLVKASVHSSQLNEHSRNSLDFSLIGNFNMS